MMYLILIVIAAFAKAIMDNLKDGYAFGDSVFMQGLNKSWVNKYKSDTDLRPRFWGSTTVFVWLTDLWHLAQMVFLVSLFSLLLLPKIGFFEIALLFTLFLIFFELFFRVLRDKLKFNTTDLFIVAILSIGFGAFGLALEVFNNILLWKVLLFTGIGILFFGFFYGIYVAIKENRNDNSKH